MADAPATNGGSPVTSYTVTVSRPGSPVHTLTRTTPGPVTFTGLAPLTGYTVRAVARNAVGTSGTAIKEVRTTALPAVIDIPATRLTPVPGMSISLTGAGLFGVGSGALTPAARTQLAWLARDLTGTKAILCEGFADNGSNTLANYWLGLSRASTVCNTLKADGVKATTSFISYGGTHPMWSRRAVIFVQR
jgi:outer membrane protein OmpA-like peptidoglycan-associated protein